MDYIKIGEFLKSLRKAKGFTQQEVADELFVSQKTISKWERGDGVPDITIVGSVASFYGVTVDELLNGERSRPNQSEYTIKAKEGERLKFIKRRLTNNLNIFNISALAIGLILLILDCFLGIYVDIYVGTILGAFALVIPLIIFLIGYYLSKENIYNNDAGLTEEDLNSLKVLMSKKIFFFHNVFFGILLVAIILYSVFFFAIYSYELPPIVKPPVNESPLTYQRPVLFVLFNLFFIYFYFFLRKVILNLELRNSRYIASGLYIPAIFYSIMAIITLVVFNFSEKIYPLTILWELSYGFFIFCGFRTIQAVINLAFVGISCVIASIACFKLRKIWLLLITLPLGIASSTLYVVFSDEYRLTVSAIGIASLILAVISITIVMALEYKMKKENICHLGKSEEDHSKLLASNIAIRNTFIALALIGLLLGTAIMLVATSLYKDSLCYLITAIGFSSGFITIAIAYLVAKLMIKRKRSLEESDKKEIFFLLRSKYGWILDYFMGVSLVIGLITSITFVPFIQRSQDPVGTLGIRISFIAVLSIMYILIRQLILIKREVSNKDINKVLLWSTALIGILMIFSFLQTEFCLYDVGYSYCHYAGIILFTRHTKILLYQSISLAMGIGASIGILISAIFNKKLPIYVLIIIGIAIQGIITKDPIQGGYVEIYITPSNIGLIELAVLIVLMCVGVTNYIRNKIKNK